jgi:hypothetical protein
MRADSQEIIPDEQVRSRVLEPARRFRASRVLSDGVTRKADNPDQRISDDTGAFIASTQIFTVVLVFGRLEARVER